MDKDTFAGQWKQVKGKILQRWGELTNDDLARINGKWDIFVSVLQKKYGYSREQAEVEIDHFMREQEPEAYPTH